MCGERPTDKSCVGAVTLQGYTSQMNRGVVATSAKNGLALSPIAANPTAVAIFIKRGVLPLNASPFSDASLSLADPNERCLQKRKERQPAHRRLKLSAALEHRLRGEEWRVLHRRKRAMRTGRVRGALHTNRAEFS